MTVLTYQSSFEVPIPASVAATPVQGVRRFNDPTLRQPRFAGAAMAATGLFLVLVPPAVAQPPFAEGWRVADPQPPHPRPERAGALAGGIAPDAPLLGWRNAGWEIQPPQPPHPRPERAAALAPWSNIDAILRGWQNAGWEIAPPQPPHPHPEASGAVARGDDGIPFPLLAWFNPGWHIAPPQPPHPRPERAAAVLRGDDGTEAPFVPSAPSPITWGAEPPAQAARAVRRLAATADTLPPAPLLAWFYTGWETVPPQPPHPRPERAAAIAAAATVDARLAGFLAYGWETQPPMLRHPAPERAGAVAPLVSIDAAFTLFRPAGWAVAPFQPPHPAWQLHGAGLRGDDGTEAKFIPPSPFVPRIFAAPDAQARPPRRVMPDVTLGLNWSISFTVVPRRVVRLAVNVRTITLAPDLRRVELARDA